jgi:4-amino-4-deoxy-L-arabinose transferase-like glycosyltransferase
MKCSFLCLVSQILSYMSFAKLGLPSLYIGELILDVCSTGIIMCFLCMARKQTSSLVEYAVWNCVMLACLYAGSHWSNFLTVSAHSHSIESVYFNSALFSVLASMSVFIVVVIQKGLRNYKRLTHELDRRSWNMASIWFISGVRLKTFMKSHLKHHILLMITAYVIGMLTANRPAILDSPDNLISNTLLWLVIVVVIIASPNLTDRIDLVLLVLTAGLTILGVFTDYMPVFGLAVYHVVEIMNIINIGQLNSYIYYVIATYKLECKSGDLLFSVFVGDHNSNNSHYNIISDVSIIYLFISCDLKYIVV